MQQNGDHGHGRIPRAVLTAAITIALALVWYGVQRWVSHVELVIEGTVGGYQRLAAVENQVRTNTEAVRELQREVRDMTLRLERLESRNARNVGKQ